MLVLHAPSPTDAKFMGTVFMAAYLLPTASGPSPVEGPQVGLSVGGLPESALAADQENVALPVGSQVGLSVGGPHVGSSVGGPPVPLSAVAPVDPGDFSPPTLVLGIFFPGGFGSSLGASRQEPLPELLSLPLFGSWGVLSSSHDSFCWLWCLRRRCRPSSSLLA